MLDLPATSDDLQVAVTFDDGYQSVLMTAAPVLQQAGVSPTLFVNTSCIGDSTRTVSDPARGYYPHEPFLLWHEVAQLRAAGWGIGSHGNEHPDLTGEPVPRIREQMMRSKLMLEDRLDVPCTMFAYPFGRHNARVRAAAAESGYRWALGSIHGPLHHGVDRYAVPRIDIRRNYELRDFIGLIRGDWDYLHLLQSARHAFRVFS
jgi:peptidoglycan/xylan/chitin deacetylase (PgdA/CDA1 family)